MVVVVLVVGEVQIATSIAELHLELLESPTTLLNCLLPKSFGLWVDPMIAGVMLLFLETLRASYVRIGIFFRVKLLNDIGLLAPGEFVRTKELNEEETHTLGLAGTLPFEGGDCLALAGFQLLPKTFGKTALVPLREGIVPVFSLIFWSHDAQDQCGPVGLLARFAGPDARSHAAPNTGLVHSTTIGLEDWHYDLAHETVEPVTQLLTQCRMVCEHLGGIAILQVSLELCDGVLLILVGQLSHLLLELRQSNNDGIVGLLNSHLIGAFHSRHG